jgi:hypothetical protein
VLRITQLSRKGRLLTLKLEGSLLGPWVGIVRDACTQSDSLPRRPTLDLAGVTYADAAGTQLLRDLLREGFEIVACSSFLCELLQRKEP